MIVEINTEDIARDIIEAYGVEGAFALSNQGPELFDDVKDNYGDDIIGEVVNGVWNDIGVLAGNYVMESRK